MIIQVNFGADDHEFFSCSPEIGKNIHALRDEFLDWIYDKTIDHQYWVYHEGKKYGVSYRTDAFVDWIKNIRCKNMKITAEQLDRESVKRVDERIFF